MCLIIIIPYCYQNGFENTYMNTVQLEHFPWKNPGLKTFLDILAKCVYVSGIPLWLKDGEKLTMHLPYNAATTALHVCPRDMKALHVSSQSDTCLQCHSLLCGR